MEEFNVLSLIPGEWLEPIFNMTRDATRAALAQHLRSQVISDTYQSNKFTQKIKDGIGAVYEGALNKKSVDPSAFESAAEFREFIAEFGVDDSKVEGIEQVMAVSTCNDVVVAMISGVFHEQSKVFAIWYYMADTTLADAPRGEGASRSDKIEQKLNKVTKNGIRLYAQATICALMAFLIRERGVRAITFEVSCDTRRRVSRLELFNGIRKAMIADLKLRSVHVDWNQLNLYLCGWTYRCPNYGVDTDKSVPLHFNVIPFDQQLVSQFSAGEVDKAAMREILGAQYDCYHLSYTPDSAEGRNAYKSAQELLAEFDVQARNKIAVQPLG